jgi:CheY-like chemotaxis protein
MSANTDPRLAIPATESLKDSLQLIAEATVSIQEFCRSDPSAAKAISKLLIGLECAQFAANQLTTVSEAQAKAVTTPVVAGLPQALDSSEALSSSNASSPKKTILIIDDEEFIILFAKDILETAGYRVIGCTDPFEAIEVYKKYMDSITLVILDYTLPIMNGAEVFAELQAIDPKVAVMLSSGYSEQKDVKDMLKRGLHGFLPKPYSVEKLLSSVNASVAASAR